MSTFTGEQLESFGVDPRQPITHAMCPFCGLVLLWGYRVGLPRGTAQIIAHQLLPAPDGNGYTNACDRFRELSHTTEFLRLLASSGVKFRPLPPVGGAVG